MSDENAAEPQSSSDFDDLINVLLPAATEALEESGFFSPVGAFVNVEGQVAQIAVDYEGGEPEPQEIVEAIHEGLRDEAVSGKLRASAVCSIVIAQLEEDEPTDAVCVTLEHVDADPVNVMLPYTLNDGKYEFGELVASHGESTIFGSSA